VQPDIGCDRGDIDQGAISVVEQRRQGSLCQPHSRHDMQVHHLLLGAEVGADKLAYSPKASVVDQDGQVVQLSNHSLDLSDTTLLGQVGGQDCTAHARL
jgi:hypothetical protein